jgi:hypothetical protein
MNRSGRVSFLGLVGFFGIIVLVTIVLLTGRESLTSIGGRFMEALAKGDVDTLTKMSYVGNDTPEDLRKQWDFAVNTAGVHYNFLYKITGSQQADAKTGAVSMSVTRDATNPGAYEQNYQLPLLKVGDEWKVDVHGISREMYPALPQ